MSAPARQNRSTLALEERNVANPGGVNAMLGRGSVFEGKLAFEGTVHIDGTFTGEIHSKDTLIIGDGAKVEGDIDVGTLVIHGEVTGHLRARQVLELQSTARVRGTVLTPSLIVSRGAIFEGTTKMENLDSPQVTQPAPARPVPSA